MSSKGFNLDDYVDVAERIRIFRDQYPHGSLQARVIRWPYEASDIAQAIAFIAVEARAYRAPDDPRPGIGHAWEPFPGHTPYTKDSELMVAETSAWGRAIVAVLAADTKRGVASKQEVRNRKKVSPATSPPPAEVTNTDGEALDTGLPPASSSVAGELDGVAKDWDAISDAITAEEAKSSGESAGSMGPGEGPAGSPDLPSSNPNARPASKELWKTANARGITATKALKAARSLGFEVATATELTEAQLDQVLAGAVS
jgi:hypothetical protein